MNAYNPKILMIASTGPSPQHPHQAVFIQRWAQQLSDFGCDIQVFTRLHITLGTYISSWSRVREFYTAPKLLQYDWNKIPVSSIKMHMTLPLNYSSSAVERSYRVIQKPLHEIYKQFKFDFMYMATWGDFSLAAARVAQSLNVPYMATAIGGYENRYYNKLESIPYKIQRQLYEGSKEVLCVSRDLEKKVGIMTDGHVATSTWDSGVDLQHFKPSEERRTAYRKKMRVLDNEMLISFVGRLNEQKGIYELLQAFKMLLEKNSELKLALIGHTNNKRELNKQIQVLKLENNVLLTGGIPADKIVGYLNASDLFVFPSWHEGLPNVIKEASACALPIIASGVGGIPEIIKNNENGILVPPKNHEALFKSMHRLVNDADLRLKLGRTARNNIKRDYDYHQNGKILVRKIKQIISEHRQ